MKERATQTIRYATYIAGRLAAKFNHIYPEIALPALRVVSIIDRIGWYFGGSSQPIVVFGINSETHAKRHLINKGIETGPVKEAIRNDLTVNSAFRPIGGNGWTATISVEGQSINYSAYRLSDGRISAGSIRPPK